MNGAAAATTEGMKTGRARAGRGARRTEERERGRQGKGRRECHVASSLGAISKGRLTLRGEGVGPKAQQGRLYELSPTAAVSSEARAKLRDWASVAARGRLLLSGNVAHASLKTAVICQFATPRDNIIQKR